MLGAGVDQSFADMRSLTEAALYPGVGLLERQPFRGRGTDTPFEVIGAPWLDGPRLATYLNARRIPGVRFIPPALHAQIIRFQE